MTTNGTRVEAVASGAVPAAAAAWRPRLDLVMAAALFSTGGAFIKWCDLAPLQIAGLRSLVAAIVLLLIWPATRRGFTRGSLLFGVLYATTLIAFVTANKLTTAANAIFLQSTAPLFVLLLSPFALGEKVRRSDLVFMAALAGGLALCFGDSGAVVQSTAPRPLLGNAIALLSGVAWAATIIGLRWFGQRAKPGQDGAASSVVVGNLTSFAAAWLIATCLSEPFFPDRAFLERETFAPTLGSLLFLGVLQVGLAYYVLSRGMKSVPAVEASLLLLVEPVFSPLWAYLVHHEVPGAWTLAGGGVILVATALHAMANARRSATLGESVALAEPARE
ncbi:MAG: EamA/RhaT family transporter [Planctomycetes bacterium]|nr:EamA/RhaT family transporter [Planctomycetota bacterium]